MPMRLLPFDHGHFELLARWFANEAEVAAWGGPYVRHPLDAAQLRPMLEEASASPPARSCWMAEADGALIGHAQLVFDRPARRARLARVAVAPEARGRGHAGTMVRLIVAEAFRCARIDRIDLNVFTWNFAAIRAYEGAGFVHEEVRRASVRVGHEAWDSAVMTLRRTDSDAAAQPPSAQGS